MLEVRQESSATGEVTYKGLPVSALLTSSTEEIIDILGIPLENVMYKKAYAAKVRELAAEDNTAHFALIDLTGSDVPELTIMAMVLVYLHGQTERLSR